MAVTRQQARQHARESQAGAAPSASFIELVAGAVAVAVQRAMENVQTLPGCAVCVHEAKVREAIALKALEPPPVIGVQQSMTVIGGRPVCWDHADEPAEPPLTLNEKRARGGLAPFGFAEADMVLPGKLAKA